MCGTATARLRTRGARSTCSPLALCLVDEAAPLSRPGADEAELTGLLRELGADSLARLLATAEIEAHVARRLLAPIRPGAT